MSTIMRRQSGPLDLSDWMSRMFDDRFLSDRLRWGSALSEKDALRVEEFFDNDTLVVRAEMPGIDPDKDVTISMHDGLLHIKAERHELTERQDKQEYRSEFHYGMFERALPLPAGVTDKDVTATYKDGILEIRMPKAADAQIAKAVPVIRLP